MVELIRSDIGLLLLRTYDRNQSLPHRDIPRTTLD